MTDMTPEQRSAALREGARQMGLIDLDLVFLAQESVPVSVALKELQLKYPAAFKPPFDARTAPRTEVDARWREMQQANSWTGRRNAEIADAITQAGDVRNMPDAEYKALCRKIGLR